MSMNDFDINRIPDDAFHEAVYTAFASYSLTKTASEYNFRCPICKDSKKSKFKKRAYIYFGKAEWVYKCFNGACPVDGNSLLNVLKEYYNDIYKKLIFQGFSNKTYSKKKEIDEKSLAEKTYRPTGIKCFKPGELISIFDNDPLAKIALEFCIKRRIRKDVYSKWFVCLRDKKFLDKDQHGNVILNEKGFPKGNEYGYRLIIPYYKYGGFWTQFDARDLHEDSNLRYRNVEGVTKEFYNIEWLDVKKPFFMLEGAIDSSFIKNAVSFGGTKGLLQLLSEHPEILSNKENGIFIWDNDDAGRDQLEQTSDMGFKWFNWSSIEPIDKFKYNKDGTSRNLKDINDAILYSDCFEQEDNEYIKLDSLMKFVEEPNPIKLKAIIGDRRQMKYDKKKSFLNNQPSNNINFMGGNPLSLLMAI